MFVVRNTSQIRIMSTITVDGFLAPRDPSTVTQRHSCGIRVVALVESRFPGEPTPGSLNPCLQGTDSTVSQLTEYKPSIKEPGYSVSIHPPANAEVNSLRLKIVRWVSTVRDPLHRLKNPKLR